MIIKRPEENNKFLNKLKIRKRYKIIILSLILLSVCLGLVLLKGLSIYKPNLARKVKQVLQAPYYYIKSTSAHPELITIDIKHKHYQKLAYNRKVALERRVLFPDCRDEVPATIRYNGDSIKVKLRLKGDLNDHWKDKNKWSFRIKVKGENSIFGMKLFSIQQPLTRGYLNEWVFHKLLKYSDFLTIRYDFIGVTLNGKNLGIYAIEESFEKRLVENNNYRDGVILKFDDSSLFFDVNNTYKLIYDSSSAYLPIDTYQTNKIEENVLYKNQFNIAKNLLESFRRKELPVNQVFNVQRIAMLFAITDLFGIHHSTNQSNIRFYYNPITSLFEPIGFDNSGIMSISIEKLQAENPEVYYWISLFFKDKIFFEEYVKALEKISDKEYLDTFFNVINEEYDEKLNILHKSFPWYQFGHKKKILYYNQEYIRKALNPLTCLFAYFHKSSKNRLELELGNCQSIPIEIINVSYQDSIIFLPENEILLTGKFSSLIDCQNIIFSIPENFTFTDTMISDLKVHYKLLGTTRLRYESIFSWRYLNTDFIENDFIRQPPNINEFDFLTINEETKVIFFEPGEWNLRKNLIIPMGYKVFAVEGLRLNIYNSAKILSYSPLKFIGSEDNPISICSPDSTGQGIVVMNANEESSLEYVIFDNLSNPSQSGWELTSAITFYESPVKISYCQFSHSRAEDALNIFRTEFEINYTLFSEIMSDAFDADFANGKITNSSFIECGNDAIDISGSIIELNNIFIDGIGDKGLSAGENSQITANLIEIKNTEIAITSKDMSNIIIEDIKLENNTIGFTVFQKKAEFGSASIIATNLEMNEIKIPYLVETQSTLVVDGKTIEASRENVKDILYGVEYGKSSK